MEISKEELGQLIVGYAEIGDMYEELLGKRVTLSLIRRLMNHPRAPGRIPGLATAVFLRSEAREWILTDRPAGKHLGPRKG